MSADWKPSNGCLDLFCATRCVHGRSEEIYLYKHRDTRDISH